MEPRDIQEQLTDLVQDLNGLIDQEWQRRPISIQADPQRNAVRDILHEHDHRLEELYRAVQHPTPGHDAAIFRRRILGNDNSNSRAKIFAILLLQGSAAILKIWKSFLEILQEPGFVDAKLPFKESDDYHYFGRIVNQQFLLDQHTYCPIDPAHLDQDFSDILRRLQLLINNDATIDYKCINENSEVGHDPTQRWTSASKLRIVFEQNASLVKNLFIGLQRRKQPDSQSLVGAQLRAHYERVMRHADVFYSGLLSRERLFAILVSSGISDRSETWWSFACGCVEPSSQTSGSLSALSDSDLPLTWGRIRQACEKGDDKMFHDAQSQFLPLKLKHGQEHKWTCPGLPVFPFLEKEYIDRGGFGSVFKVVVAAGYYNDEADQALAMKVVDRRSNHERTEWDIAECAKLSEKHANGVVIPTVLVSTACALYYFMELADCSLAHLMQYPKEVTNGWNTVNGCRDPEGIASEVSEYDDIDAHDAEVRRIEKVELEEHYNSMLPHDYESRKDTLKWMIPLAEALKDLHYDHRPAVIYHVDVKLKNVLYTRGRKRPLRLSDFGISRLKYALPNVGEGNSSDARRTQIELGTAMPNFPPEACGTHRIDHKGDIWALGVLFAEFVAWVSGGPAAVQDLKRRRDEELPDNPREQGSLSWVLENNRPVLNRGIEAWFLELIDRSTGEQKSLFEDCWLILSKGLLIIDPHHRIKACDIPTAFHELTNRDTEAIRQILPQERTHSQSSRVDSVHSTKPQADSVRPRPRETSSTLNTSVPSGGVDQIRKALQDENSRLAADLINEHTDTSKDQSGNTLYHLAVQCPGTEATAALTRYFPDMMLEYDDAGLNALHKCARINTVYARDHARLLIDGDPSIVDSRDAIGRTALVIAKRKGSQNNPMFRLLQT